VKAGRKDPERLRRKGYVKEICFSLESKAEEVTDVESEVWNCDEVMCTG